MSLVYRPDHPMANENGMVERHLAPPKTSPRSAHSISDIEPFQTQDKVAITSRKDLRAYEQANGVRQVGNDWTGSERPAFWDRVSKR